MIDLAAYALLKRGLGTSSGPAVGINGAHIDPTNHLILELTNNDTIDCGLLPTNEDLVWSIVETALSELMPAAILGGWADDPDAIIHGGSSTTDEPDVLYGMDADEEPIGIKFTGR